MKELIADILKIVKEKHYLKTEITDLLNNLTSSIDNKLSLKSDKEHNHKITDVNNLESSLNGKVDKVNGKGLSTNDYTTDEKTKLENIEPNANKTIVDSTWNPTSTNPVQARVINETFYDKEDIVDLLNNIETGSGKLLTVYIDETTGDLVVDDDSYHYYNSDECDEKFPAIIEKQSTAESGYLATYVLKQDGSVKGAKINIPKDFLVKSASIGTSSANNNPVTGFSKGDKYIDFVINTKDDNDTDEHLYLNVKDLVDVYTADESTLTMSNNQFSVKEIPVSKISGVLPASQVTHQDISGKVNITDIVDNLTSDSSDKPLSANQGSMLGLKIDIINQTLTTIRTNTAFINQRLDDIMEGTVPIYHASTDGDYGIGDANYYGHVKVDTGLSVSSSNPVQNKAIYSALANKVNSSALAGVAFTGSYNQLSDKPTIPSKTSQLTNDSGFLTTHQSLSNYIQKSSTSGFVKNDGTIDTNTYLTSHQDITSKVDKVDGKELSTNDFTDTYKSQLDGYDTVDVVVTYEDGTTETKSVVISDGGVQ